MGSSLSGHGIELVAYQPSLAPALFAVTPRDTFRYFPSWPDGFPDSTLPAFALWMESHLGPDPSRHRRFVVRDAATGAVLGSSSFIDIDPRNRAVEIGATWYADSARGTHVNPACKLLMLAHAFEGPSWGPPCERVQLKCDSRNARSAAAIAKLGAVREGVLRSHRVCSDAFVRDTTFFSIIRDEWPNVRSRLLERLGSPRGAAPPTTREDPHFHA
jgi:RimJ/RimL family protein N-acetyltransferase